MAVSTGRASAECGRRRWSSQWPGTRGPQTAVPSGDTRRAASRSPAPLHEPADPSRARSAVGGGQSPGQIGAAGQVRAGQGRTDHGRIDRSQKEK